MRALDGGRAGRGAGGPSALRSDLGARVARRAVSAGWASPRQPGDGARLATGEKAAAGRNDKFKIPPATRPTSAARAIWDCRRAERPGAPDLSALRAASSGAVKRSTCSILGPRGRSATCVDRRGAQVRQAAVAHRSGRAPGRSRERRRYRAAGSAWVEKDATYTNDQGRCRRPRASSSPPARRWKTGRSSSNVASRSARRCLHTVGAGSRRLADDAERQPALRGLATWTFARPVSARTLAAGVESVRALEVGLHVPGSAAGQVRGTARVPLAHRAIPLKELK